MALNAQLSTAVVTTTKRGSNEVVLIFFVCNLWPTGRESRQSATGWCTIKINLSRR